MDFGREAAARYAQQIGRRSNAPRTQERLRLAGAPRKQIFAAEKLNRLGPTVVCKQSCVIAVRIPPDSAGQYLCYRLCPFAPTAET